MRKTVAARNRHVCDLCGGVIEKGEACYKVMDDFMVGMVVYEHRACPRGVADGGRTSRIKAAQRRAGRRFRRDFGKGGGC